MQAGGWSDAGVVGSERCACGLVKVHRATCRYRRRRVEDPRLRERLRELAGEPATVRVSAAQILLKREGFTVNHKRVYRLYVEEKLGLRRERGRRGLRPRPPHACPSVLPVRPDHAGRWTSPSMRSPVGASFNSNLMDGFTRYAPRIEVDTSSPGQRVVRGAGRTEAKRAQAGGDRDRRIDVHPAR